MTSVSDIDKELIRLLFLKTKDRKFTEDVWYRFRTDEEKNSMIYFLTNCENPTIFDINVKSLDIIGPRLKTKKQ